jgi:hypothetical protein
MMLEGIHLDRSSRISLRKQLVGQLETRILGGHIAPGRRLPSVRRVEELLGIHRNTVVAAYRDLVQAGLARARPGSGVYARSPASSGVPGVATLLVSGPRDVRIGCCDSSMFVVLAAEVRARFALRVERATSGAGPSGMAIRLMPSPGFLRSVCELGRPSLVAIVSGCEHVQRLTSAVVLIHAGEGVACLPVPSGDRSALRRWERRASLIVADYAALPWARNVLSSAVLPLPLISAPSVSALSLLLRRHRAPRSESRHRSPKPERSSREGVHQP